MTTHAIPDGLPVLSRGRHRNPRKGACFMEMASVLANEPWSDRPQCTHPLLAQLARLVNDHTTDSGRGDLAVMIPEVVGVHGGDLDWEVALVAAVAGQAIYDVPEETQRALAAGLLRCAELTPPGDGAGIRAALDRAPGAEQWARRFIDGAPPIRPKAFRKHTSPAVMLSAVRGLARAAVPDPDARLRDLLRTGIDAARGPVQSMGRSSSAYETDWRRKRPSAPTAY